MKIFFILLLCVSVNGCAQKVKQSLSLYCNNDSIKKWNPEGWMSCNATYIKHNGKWYQDTSDCPPFEMLKLMGDTVIESVSVTDTDIALKVSDCGKCSIYTILAVRRSTQTDYFHYNLYVDIRTGKHHTSGGGNWVGDEPLPVITYLDHSKKPFKGKLIWPNN